MTLSKKHPLFFRFKDLFINDLRKGLWWPAFHYLFGYYHPVTKLRFGGKVFNRNIF